ncbi:MAG: hypothetical protein R2705_18410 [Ilumatobacteraceae bacterium]
MRAAVLEEWGAPLVISEVPDPQIGTGEIIVDVVSARVLNYTCEVLSGDRNYLLALPAIPGRAASAGSAPSGPMPPLSRSATSQPLRLDHQVA